MSANLPAICEPLTPADCDLRAYEFMPLSVDRLRDARIISEVSAEGFRAAILLWCASWHQVPAASMPDDDRQLARFAGYGIMVKAWLEVREEALYGFVRCSDGRLYHPVVAEKANESWASRQKFIVRSDAANAAKAAKAAAALSGKKPSRHPSRNDPPPTRPVSNSYKEPFLDLSEVKGIEEREEVFSNENTVRADLAIELPDLMAEGFERWWKVYPKRRGKKAAVSAFGVAVRKIGAKGQVPARIDFLIDRAQALADNLGAETTFAPDPERWLRGERWDDELKPRHAHGAAANGRHASPAQRPGVQHLHEAALALAQRRPGLASLLPRDCDVPDAAE